MGFPRQEYWSGLTFPPPGDLPNPWIKPVSRTMADRFFTNVPPGKPIIFYMAVYNFWRDVAEPFDS